VIPSVETIIDLSARKLYENAIPELEDSLNKSLREPWRANRCRRGCRIFFGTSTDARLERFGRLLFDWFRAPILELTLKDGDWVSITRIGLLPLGKLDEAGPRGLLPGHGPLHRAAVEGRQVAGACALFLRHAGRSQRSRCRHPRLQVSSTGRALPRAWAFRSSRSPARICRRLANFDALFIRETTSISNHTYRFARRAQQEGMPVIDDPVSMIRCTNKVYLDELMASNGIPVPDTVMLIGPEDFQRAADQLGFPMVLKVPDSSFSRGVKKVASMAELKALAGAWLHDSEVLIAQKFMPTKFRLAHRRSRRQAAVRGAVPDGQEALADRQA
jgi:hypothetical protein